MKFRGFCAGTRVKVYATLNGDKAETKGTVLKRNPDGTLEVELEKIHKWKIVAHPKQCRRLVRKKK